MDAFGAAGGAVLVGADFTVDDHDLVGGAAAVPRQDEQNDAEQDEHGHDGHHDHARRDGCREDWFHTLHLSLIHI